jgi:hypothetical protein
MLLSRLNLRSLGGGRARGSLGYVVDHEVGALEGRDVARVLGCSAVSPVKTGAKNGKPWR